MVKEELEEMDARVETGMCSGIAGTAVCGGGMVYRPWSSESLYGWGNRRVVGYGRE